MNADQFLSINVKLIGENSGDNFGQRYFERGNRAVFPLAFAVVLLLK